MSSLGTKIFKKEVNKSKAISWKRHLEFLTTEERLTQVGLLTLNLKRVLQKVGDQLSHQSTVGRTKKYIYFSPKKFIKTQEQISYFLHTEKH